MAVDIHGLAPLLQVFDMPASLRFYRDVLGFQLIATSGSGDRSQWVLLRHGDVELMLNTAYEPDQRPASPDATRVAHHADASLYFGCADLERAYEYLRSNDVNASAPRVAPYGMKQMYVTDPDGYVLCFQSPASDTTRAQWQQWYGAAQ
jgi:glyoxylase I family protein